MCIAGSGLTMCYLTSNTKILSLVKAILIGYISISGCGNSIHPLCAILIGITSGYCLHKVLLFVFFLYT